MGKTWSYFGGLGNNSRIGLHVVRRNFQDKVKAFKIGTVCLLKKKKNPGLCLLAGEVGTVSCHGKRGPDAAVTGANCAVDTLIKKGNIGCEYKECADLIKSSSAWLGELEGMIN